MNLPGYTIDSELYRGRKRVVYRARRRWDGHPVVLKGLADDFPSPADTASLRREYEILQSLSAQGVARALALESHRDRAVLVLQECGDTTLKALIAEDALDIARALSVAHQLASTLAEVHRAGIVHKDVSASNVIVDRSTMHVTIADFGIASRARSEPQRLGLPHLIEGTLAYMSPEQTGRMNRDLDSRSDLYSLGVVCYEMLTGRLPFDSADPLEVIHAHVAQMPVSPAERDPQIPRPVSALVMKLLAKNAEDRYQSGEGVAADLARCLAEWEASGSIAPFPLAQDDVRDRFVISQRLYGRESEVASLHDAFERVAAGETELVLVSGYSGIGKTSLVQETYRSLAQRPGHYAAGKFDLLARDVPYKALAQAFQGLMRDLLSETEDRAEIWRSRLREALGENGQVVVDVIPDLARLIGPQPPVPPLGAAESQNRFNLVFQRFLGILARPEHPLVLFVDDLQWADSATLTLLPLFLTNPDLRGLLVIGAYRNNEVSPSHPLSQLVRDLAVRGRPLTELVLSPLGSEHLSRLLSDTLRGTDEETIGALSTLVLAKTGGNPFFVIQFLKSLHQDAHIVFHRQTRSWRIDLAALRSLQMTENVVDLMSGRIQRLEESTQRVLRLAACVGNRFDLGTLATVSEQDPARCVADLWPAVEQGLVLQEQQSYGFPPNPTDGRPLEQQRFRFLHDRVQQAAYTLIPEAARRAVHLMVGRQLAASGSCESSESIFDVVNHLNYGSELMTDPAERQQLAELNLAAGKRAKASAAYPSALSYFAMGTSLLARDAWTEAYPLAFALHRERAEAEYLCGRFPEAEASFSALLDCCQSSLDRADVTVLMIVQFENMSRYGDAIRVGLEALRSLGVEIPDDPAALRPALARELEAVHQSLDGRAVASLLELPRLTDPALRQTMKLLLALWAPSYITCFGELRDLSAARMVRLSLEHGNCEESAYGYLGHAVTVGSVLGNYERGHEFGELALALNERLADLRLRAVVHHRFAALVNLWRRPFATCLPYAREAVRAGLESGNLHVAGYAQFQQSWYGMMIERDLTAFQENYASSVDVLARLQNRGFLQMQRLILQWGRALQGQTETPTTLTGPDFDETSFLQSFGQGGIFRGLWATLKLELLNTFGHVEEARLVGRDEESVAEQFTGSIWPALFAFRHALALCAWLPGAAASERSEAEAKLDALAARLQRWADNAPENFAHFHLLASAEIARVRNRAAEAVTLYEAAIDAAAGLDSPRHRALANDLYGRFWFERRHPQIARGFLSEARYGYAAWGATAKVADLDRCYQDLLRERTGLPSGSGASPVLGTTQTLDSALDAIAVARAAQAVSREIELEKLLEQLLRVALEGAGAERGSLLLEREQGEPGVFVEGTVASIRVRAEQATPFGAADLPHGVVNFVRRSAESVVLDDAAGDPRYGDDPYIVRARPQSILCTPILNQGKLTGVLYMENRLSAGAFTRERVEIMQILSAQAAIAIANARMFAEIRELKDRLQAENVYLIEEIKTQQGFEEIVGRTPELRKVLSQVEQVAPTDTTVLITGETGTGKELVARAVHGLSPRRERALLTVNCGAISAGLVESELFGHEKGAFTGALNRRIGRFELAEGGTIFLDEIGDLPLDLQVKLLRVLQEREIERVGGNRPIKVDVRVIAATHRDLAQLVREGRFRADLFYRLNVFPIWMPPLRERRADIPLLVGYLVFKYGQKLGKRIESIPSEIMQALSAYDWPGNIRELANVLERSVIVTRGAVLELGDWIPQARSSVPPVADGRLGLGLQPPAPRRLEEVERRHIIETLQRTGWKVRGATGAATILGLQPTTLESRMKKLGIRRPNS